MARHEASILKRYRYRCVSVPGSDKVVASIPLSSFLGHATIADGDPWSAVLRVRAIASQSNVNTGAFGAWAETVVTVTHATGGSGYVSFVTPDTGGFASLAPELDFDIDSGNFRILLVYTELEANTTYLVTVDGDFVADPVPT